MQIIDQFHSCTKINLFLDIVKKDPHDGYHFLESIFTEMKWGDNFVISYAEKDQIIFNNKFIEKIAEENTISKALKLFKQKYHIDKHFFVQVTKNVPMGAGLGGGSGDAGYLLRWLCHHYEIPSSECIDIAQKIGSDVPYFLYGKSALVEGKGEKITVLEGKIDPTLNILLIYPNYHISTKKAFQMIASEIIKDNKKKYHFFLEKNIWTLDFLSEMNYNIFDNYLESISLHLFDIKKYLNKTLCPDLIFLTGSGSSFVLLYQDNDKLQKAVSYIDNMEKHLTYFIQSN